MAAALETHCGDVTVIEPPPFCSNLGKRTLAALRFRQAVLRELERQTFDLAFAPQSSPAIALLGKVATPIVLCSDLTWRLVERYYPNPYKSPWKLYLRQLLETHAIRKAAGLIYSSEWAAQSAHLDYGVERRKLHVAPFGANIDQAPPRNEALSRRVRGTCELLFLAVDWNRKGGEIAVNTVRRLRELGISARLTVCGCVPPAASQVDELLIIPFIDKNEREGRERLNQLLRDADFLLLPTRADCTPVVICEAGAHGLPVITTDTGGVSGIVSQGINGHMLPLDATGEDYAQVIAILCHDDSAYRELVRGSRRLYEERLNWDAWGVSVAKYLRNLFEGRQVRPTGLS